MPIHPNVRLLPISARKFCLPPRIHPPDGNRTHTCTRVQATRREPHTRLYTCAGHSVGTAHTPEHVCRPLGGNRTHTCTRVQATRREPHAHLYTCAGHSVGTALAPAHVFRPLGRTRTHTRWGNLAQIQRRIRIWTYFNRK